MDLVIASPEQMKAELCHAFESLLRLTNTHNIALTGGGSGIIVLQALRQANVEWSRIACFWGDERAVPPEHPDSNFALANQLLLTPLGERAPRAFRMPADEPDLQEAARMYDGILNEQIGKHPLDLAIVGVGDDGHVCSLFPGHAALLATGRRCVAVEDAPKAPPRRLTLTLSFLNASKEIWLIGIGARKRVVLQQAMMRKERTTPLDLVIQNARRVTLFTDQMLARA